jgi:SAM-dependent methyltransferase
VDISGSYDEYFFAAQFYDFVVPYRERQDVAFFVGLAREAAGPVLEIGCGTGRVLIPTARAGVEIVGLDSSSMMLAVCREKLALEPDEVQSRVKLAKGDMRRFDLNRRFHLITMPFRPFQHLLTVEDQMDCLACVHRHLVDGGKFVLDVFNPSLPHLAGKEDMNNLLGDEPQFVMPDGRRVRRHHRLVSRDWLSQVQDLELIYEVSHPDGREEQKVHGLRMRYLFRFEAEHLLSRCGFQVEALYSGYDKSPYGSKYPGELIFVARRVDGPQFKVVDSRQLTQESSHSLRV